MAWHLLVLRMKQSYRSHITLNSVHIKTKMQPDIFIHDISDYLLLYQEEWKKYIIYHFFVSRECPSKQWKDIWSYTFISRSFLGLFHMVLWPSLRTNPKRYSQRTPYTCWQIVAPSLLFLSKSSKKLRELKQTKIKASAKACW